MRPKEPDAIERHRPDVLLPVLGVARVGAVERGDDLGAGSGTKHRQQRPLGSTPLHEVVLHEGDSRSVGHRLTFARRARGRRECGIVEQ